MPDLLAAALVGVAAGLGVAVPLGAVGVLLVRTGLTGGWRPAAAGALGVAGVDLGYAALAVLVGSSVAGLLAGREREVRVLGGLVLGAIATRGLWRLWRERRAGAGSPGGAGAAVWAGVSPVRTWARFVALTALNPMTVVYFTVAAAAFATRWQGVGERVAFVAGVGLASATWQLVLAGVGAVAGARTGPRVRVWFGAAGDLAVLALAVVLLIA